MKRDFEYLSQKNQLLHRYQQWKAQAEIYFHSRGGYLVEAVRRDKGGEDALKAFEKWLEDEGIISEYTAPYTPQ